jgi:glucose-fructose oxidoreductase
MSKFKVVGINFDHMHMGDLLRMANDHPDVEIVGVSDHQPVRAAGVLERIGLSQSLFVADYRLLMERTKPDLAILCPATGEHATWTEQVAAFGSHVLVEKPFAASVADADRMIAALKKTGKQLIINWPLRWVASHVTAKKLIDDGVIGDLLQVHYYDGNRGPLRHVEDKVVVPEAVANEQKAKAWWYRRSAGGGSLLDYLGYGTTLGTWYMNGRAPIEVTAMVDQPAGLEVDEHSVTICRYDIPNSGLSKFETRWGAFSDPWIAQPQPKCGFVLVGRKGTISSYDYEPHVMLQTDPEQPAKPVAAEPLRKPLSNAVEYAVDKLRLGAPIDGPLSPAIARIGQQIVDSAILSATQKRTVSLVP